MSEVVDIYLKGVLAKKFGGHHRFAVSSAREAVRALCSQIKGFKKVFRNADWHVFVNRIGVGIDECDLQGAKRIDIYPRLRGAGGVFKAIAGVALVAVGVVMGNPYVTTFGASLLLGGIAQMIAPTPKAPNLGDRQGVENTTSHHFDGAANRSAVGLPVPVVYGKMLIGSITASTSINVES